MGAVICNALFFIGAFVFQLLKRKRLDCSVLLFLIYALIAACGIFYYKIERIDLPVSLFYFIYLFVTCMIFFFPITSEKSICNKKNNFTVSNGIRVIIYIYIFCAVIIIMNLAHMTLALLQSGDWAQMKADAYSGGVIITRNFFEIIAGFYVDYFRLAVIIYAFYLLTLPRSKFYFSILLIILSVLPSIMASLLYVYRGGLFMIVISTFCVYLLFYKEIPSKIRKKIIGIFSIIVILIFILIFAITFSRFGENNAFDSLVNYIGQSMVEFNYGIAVPIHSYANGQYFLASILNISRDDICQDYLYGTITANGGALDTFVGCLFLDFGPILTIVFAVIISFLLYMVFCKKTNDFADLYLFMFYLEYLLLGVFHSPPGFALNSILTLIVYTILKILKNNITINYSTKLIGV